MSKAIDLTGRIFGRWEVIERAENTKQGDACFVCRCTCEEKTERVVKGASLRQGKSLSCGCLTIEASKSRATHSGTKTRLYRIWQNMKERCYNPKNTYYYNYGGRGISVCENWKDKFENFSNWAYANGYEEVLTLDRKNNNLNYSENNCRWVSRKAQANNTRKNKLILFNGEIHTMSEWSTILDITYMCLVHRIGRGWSIERAFTTPQQNRKKKIK